MHGTADIVHPVLCEEKFVDAFYISAIEDQRPREYDSWGRWSE